MFPSCASSKRKKSLPKVYDSLEAKQMAEEIKDANSVDEDFDQIDSIQDFETQPAIDIEPEVLADLMNSDNSIYNEMNEHVKDAKEPDQALGALETSETELVQVNNNESQDSGHDLFDQRTTQANRDDVLNVSSSPVKLPPQNVSDRKEIVLP